MKKLVINKNSWFNKPLSFYLDTLFERDWPDNFCSYFWSLLLAYCFIVPTVLFFGSVFAAMLACTSLIYLGCGLASVLYFKAYGSTFQKGLDFAKRESENVGMHYTLCFVGLLIWMASFLAFNIQPSYATHLAYVFTMTIVVISPLFFLSSPDEKDLTRLRETYRDRKRKRIERRKETIFNKISNSNLGFLDIVVVKYRSLKENTCPLIEYSDESNN